MLLTVKEAAERANVSPALIYDLCSQGLLPHVRLGRPGKRGTIRIDPDELDGFLAALKVEGRKPEPTPAPKAPPLKLRHLQL